MAVPTHQRVDSPDVSTVFEYHDLTLPTGSFKIRGVTTPPANLDEGFRNRRVVTGSTGNCGRTSVRKTTGE